MCGFGSGEKLGVWEQSTINNWSASPMIPLYKPVKIVLGVLFALFALDTLTELRLIVAPIFGLVSFLMFRSAYYHGKYEPPLFKRKG
jgi:hypothetical protein